MRQYSAKIYLKFDGKYFAPSSRFRGRFFSDHCSFYNFDEVRKTTDMRMLSRMADYTYQLLHWETVRTETKVMLFDSDMPYNDNRIECMNAWVQAYNKSRYNEKYPKFDIEIDITNHARDARSY